jgi:hypothetical protein
MGWIIGVIVFLSGLLVWLFVSSGDTREVSELEDWPGNKETKQ